MSKTDILLAKIGAPHGIKGEVRVTPFGEPEMLDQYGKLHDTEGRKYKIKRMRPQKNVLVVKFEGVNSREEAEALNGIELFVPRDRLPETEDEDEFYISDLIGCDVLDHEGGTVGKIVAVPNFGAGDMLEIAPVAGGGIKGANTFFIPFTEAAVPVLDLEARTVTIVPPVEVSERDADT